MLKILLASHHLMNIYIFVLILSLTPHLALTFNEQLLSNDILIRGSCLTFKRASMQ